MGCLPLLRSSLGLRHDAAQRRRTLWGRLTSRPAAAKEDARAAPHPRLRPAIWENAMDLGIAGRKAIVCASSKGLGRACAMNLAQAGCVVVVNGRNRDAVEAAAADIRKAT